METGLLTTYTYELKKLVLYTSGGDVIDIRRTFLEFDIYEDIFNPCSTASILLGDAQELLSNFRVHGNDFIEIEIDKPSLNQSIHKFYRIYKVSNRNMGTSIQNYTMHLCSEEMILSQQMSISKSYKGMKITNIVKNILKDYLKVSDNKIGKFSDSFGVYDTIIPKMNPLEAIQWLSTRAYSDKGSLYLFFENRDGFNFISYEDLLKVNPYSTYYKTVKLSDDPAKNLQTFTALTIPEDFDVVKASRYGSFSSSLKTLDLVTKSYDAFLFNSLQFKGKGILNKEVTMNGLQNRLKKTFYDSFDNMQKYVMVTDADPTNNPISPENWLAQTASRMGQLHLFKMVGVVPGDPVLKAGITINVEIQNVIPQEENASINKVRTGRYLVSTVHHKFAADIYTTTMEMLSDSVNEYMPSPANSSSKIREILSS